MASVHRIMCEYIFHVSQVYEIKFQNSIFANYMKLNLRSLQCHLLEDVWNWERSLFMVDKVENDK